MNYPRLIEAWGEPDIVGYKPYISRLQKLEFFWEFLINMQSKKNIIILASGQGSNAINLIRYFSKSYSNSKINIVAVVSNVSDAPVINKVKELDTSMPLFFIPFTKKEEKITFERKLEEIISSYNVDYIVLAGFMKILSNDFVSKYKYRIINIHPSLLPAFKGKDAIKNAFNCRVKITGITIHFIVSEVDSGPIIMQKALKVKTSDNMETLEHKIHALEHKTYPIVLDLLANEKIKIENDKVRIIV